MIYEIDIATRDVEDRITRIREGAWFLQWALIYLPNVPKPLNFDGALQFSQVYARYSNRMSYHAEQFIKNLKDIQNVLSVKVEVDQEVFMSTHDSLFFDFDAFIASAKTLVEGNIRERARHLDPWLHTAFEQLATVHFQNFVDPFLAPFRNEILHVNNFGSSLYSQLSLRNDGQVIHVSMKPVFGTFQDRSVDLIGVFCKTFEQMENIFCQVAGCILAHFFSKWGAPHNPAEVFADKSIDLTYFKIPNI